MNLSIEVRQIHNIIILELAGRVDVLENGLRELACQLIESGHCRFVVNLANVSYLDNSGLGQLCWIYTVARNRGGDLVLLRPTARIRKLLSITKLDSVFRCFEQEVEAVEAIRPFKSMVSA